MNGHWQLQWHWDPHACLKKGRQQWSEGWSAQLMGEGHWAVAVPVDASELGQQTVAGPLRQQLLVRLLAELLVATPLQWPLQPALLLQGNNFLPLHLLHCAHLLHWHCCCFNRFALAQQFLNNCRNSASGGRLEQLCQCSQWAWGKW